MTAPTVTGVLIPADPTAPARPVQVRNDLAGLRAALAGDGPAPWLEVVNLGDVDLWCDEDGKAKGLPRNARATDLAGLSLFPGDALVGDVLALGHDGSPEVASLTVNALARIREACAPFLEV